jgi:hypothetical protein
MNMQYVRNIKSFKGVLIGFGTALNYILYRKKLLYFVRYYEAEPKAAGTNSTRVTNIYPLF